MLLKNNYKYRFTMSTSYVIHAYNQKNKLLYSSHLITKHHPCQKKTILKQAIYYAYFKMVFIFRIFIA